MISVSSLIRTPIAFRNACSVTSMQRMSKNVQTEKTQVANACGEYCQTRTADVRSKAAAWSSIPCSIMQLSPALLSYAAITLPHVLHQVLPVLEHFSVNGKRSKHVMAVVGMYKHKHMCCYCLLSCAGTHASLCIVVMCQHAHLCQCLCFRHFQ